MLLIDWLVDWLSYWLIDWLSYWLIDWLIDWLDVELEGKQCLSTSCTPLFKDTDIPCVKYEMGLFMSMGVILARSRSFPPPMTHYYYYYYKMYWLEWRCYRITVAGALNNEKRRAVSAVSLECRASLFFSNTKLYCMVTEAHVSDPLVEGCYVKAERVGVEHVTFCLMVQILHKHCVTMPRDSRTWTQVCWLSVWCSSNALVSINAVALHRARLVLRWVTAFGQVNYLIM